MDLISIRDLEKKDIEKILFTAETFEKGKINRYEGKILATLFFEASTRTRMSFQSACIKLGMNYIDLAPEASSLKKGESFVDTIKVVSGYSDLLVVRHPKEGSARLAADVSKVPVINGGDGGNQHPTQTLIDLYTIKKSKGKLQGLNVTLVGDLKHARTMQSLVYALGMFGSNLTLISPPGLELDKHLVDEIENKFKIKIKTKNELDIKDADVVYMCRVQEERFADPYEAKRVKGQFTLKAEHLKDAKQDMIVMNPLPRMSEIPVEIDETKNARYFEQAHYGVPVRMAVIDYVLSKSGV
ncbi:MAG: aspartate carbamoyltransferase [Candidatus Micrarchaeota archaeon]